MVKKRMPRKTQADNIAYFARSVKIVTILRDLNIEKGNEDGMSLTEIAEAADMSVQRIVAILKKASK